MPEITGKKTIVKVISQTAEKFSAYVRFNEDLKPGFYDSYPEGGEIVGIDFDTLGRTNEALEADKERPAKELDKLQKQLAQVQSEVESMKKQLNTTDDKRKLEKNIEVATKVLGVLEEKIGLEEAKVADINEQIALNANWLGNPSAYVDYQLQKIADKDAERVLKADEPIQEVIVKDGEVVL